MSYWQNGSCPPTYVYKSKSSLKTKKQKEYSPEQYAYGQYECSSEMPGGSDLSGPLYYTLPQHQTQQQQQQQQQQPTSTAQYYMPVTEYVPYDKFFEKKKHRHSLKEKRKPKRKQNSGAEKGKRSSMIPGLTMLGGAPVFWKLIEYGLNKAKEYGQHEEDEEDYDTSPSYSSLTYQPYYAYKQEQVPAYQQTPYLPSIPMQFSYVPAPPPPLPAQLQPQPPLATSQRPLKQTKSVRVPPKVVTIEDAIKTDLYGARRFQLFLDLKGFYPNEVKIKTENKMLHVCGRKERDVSL
jgi:hypothetical protein